MATQAEVAQELQQVREQMVKIGTETQALLDKINELIAQIQSGEVTPELQAAVDAVKTQAQVVDDFVPDQPS